MLMKQNKDVYFDIASSSPLFDSFLGLSGALLCARTLQSGAVLCVFATILALSLSILSKLVSKKLSETLTFWITMLSGAVVSFPLTYLLGIIQNPESSVLFLAVGITVAYAVANKEPSDNVKAEIRSSLRFSLKYSVSVIPFAFVRELLANGSILGAKLFEGIAVFETFYGSILVLVLVAIVYKTVAIMLTKERRSE